MRLRALPALLVACLALAACGTQIRHTHADAGGTSAQARQAAQVQVIRGWARQLREGHIAAAARYFAFPSLFENGGGLFVIHSETEAIVVNASLSCGAKLLSVTPVNGLLHAVFRLVNRPGLGGGCGSGAGAEGATDFLIRDGHIAHWLRAPVHESSHTRSTPAPSLSPGSSQQV